MPAQEAAYISNAKPGTKASTRSEAGKGGRPHHAKASGASIVRFAKNSRLTINWTNAWLTETGEKLAVTIERVCAVVQLHIPFLD